MAEYQRFCVAILAFVSILFISNFPLQAGGPHLSSSLEHSVKNQIQVESDTIPMRDRYGDYITDEQYNPFDILPSNVEQTVEYDMETGNYIIYEKIGDEYFRTPTYMTFQEYLDWRAKQQERDYFDKLSGLSSEYKSGSGKIDPLSKINIDQNLVDRLFGGNDITIEPQGNIDLTFGADYQEVKNPNISLNQQRQGPFMDFDMDIKMNVEGNIGDKMNLGFNYDTNASFDFDRKINLAYDSELFSEDDIIKTIEAGNVSLPLRSTLIQGAQSLFGLKTELQFGHLRLTAIASQQRSKQETVAIQNGASAQTFEIRPDEYDENRHFFISHYHRDAFEEALSNLPYIKNNFRVSNIEVWISSNQTDYQQNQTTIVAISDIGEPDENLFSNPNANYTIPIIPDPNNVDIEGRKLPVNEANTLYQDIINNPNAERVDNIDQVLSGQYNLNNPRDYNRFLGRKLSPSEYTFNAELGVLSLNIRLRPEQVLGVSYEYFYTLNCDQVYKVGSTSDEGGVSNTDSLGRVQSEGIIYTKMLKPSNQTVNDPTWDLMMKNVYPLRTNTLDPENFEFDIFYEDDSDGSLKKYLPVEDPAISRVPLLNHFGLDKLNSRNDPQPDGVVDFVPGVTVIPQSGSIMFPVLEPFGSSLDSLLGDPVVAEQFSFPELYDTTVVGAREVLVKNKFVMIGRYESSVSSEYSLGAWNIPQGSVRVTAGSRQLVEGADYEVDYSIGRVRIINESILQQGIPINISFEDNSVFSLQQKTMLGLRAEYSVSDNFYIGGTMMRLFERPFTQKVNIGDDPINNRIYGLDMDFSTESEWITRAVDKLPFYSTSVPSNVNFTAEMAVLRPGHSGAINTDQEPGGIVHLDDFEGAVSGFPLSSQANNLWVMASTPVLPEYPEATLTNDIAYGANRARLAWYVFDQTLLFGQNSPSSSNSYTRNINQQELFDRQIPAGLLGNLQTFDLSYFPDERGPYNFDPPSGTSFSAGATFDEEREKILLNDPASRWAGIMRFLPNTDFQAANYEFIEFWMLNPFMELPNGQGHAPDEEGFISFHLGNVSEDILKDGEQFYENSIPVDDALTDAVKETEWGRIPLIVPNVAGFNVEDQIAQDLGLDGLTDEEELLKYQDYVNQFPQAIDVLAPDPSGDNFASFNDFSENGFEETDDILTRYSRFNNPQGNSPSFNNTANNNQTTLPSNVSRRGQPRPDSEDLNNNRSPDVSESFYEYKVRVANNGGLLDEDNPFVRDKTVVNRNGQDEVWYRFRIPLNQGEAINGIEGFRSIQFMRIIINGFETQKTFRLAEFELIRNQWRRLPVTNCANDAGTLEPVFDVDAVGIEENNSKEPFPYVLPVGIQRERLFNTFSNVLQDEKSMALKYCEVSGDECELSVYKLTELDLRQYERMQMFVHAEAATDAQKDGDMSVFLRVGKDYTRHYYEYEIPLTLSDTTELNTTSDSEVVWLDENKFDFPLELFRQAKKIRIAEGAPIDEEFIIDNDFLSENIERLSSQFSSIGLEVDTSGLYLPKGHRVRVIGNPNLGRVKGIQIGVRNIAEDTPPEGFCGEVWVNELRLTGLQERAGIAGLARLDVQLADLGNLTAAASYSSIGFGALDDRVHDRALESVTDYDVSTSLELGKFLPQGLGLKVPFYAQYSKSIVNPEFDAYDFDITKEDQFDLKTAKGETDDQINNRNQTVTTIKTFNFTNVRKERSTGNNRRTGSTPDPSKDPSKSAQKSSAPTTPSAPKKPKKPMPWDISNFSASYAYTETDYRDPLIEFERSKDYTLGVDYNFSRRGGYLQPFKKLKAKPLKFIKEINFNPLPNSLVISSNIKRFESERRFRGFDPDDPNEPIIQFDDRRYTWQRSYDLNWNLTKSLKMNFSALNESYIDELRQIGIADTPENREWVDEFGKAANDQGENYTDLVRGDSNAEKEYRRNNLRNFGRNTNYSHQLSLNYTLPMKHIPILDWIDVKAQYRANYTWAAGPLIEIDPVGNTLGAIIQNGQNRSVTANLNFDKLYNKSKFIKNLDRSKSTRNARPRSRSTAKDDPNAKEDANVGNKDRSKKEKEISGAAKFLLRPLFMIRSLRINYKEDLRTVVPGFTGTPEYLGLSSGFSSPGWGFVLGQQPDITFRDTDNWLYQAADKGWITNSTALNQEVLQNKTQNLDARLKIEPWKDVRLEIEFEKNYSLNHQEEFKNKDINGNNFQQIAARDIGSFDLTYYTMKTLFGTDIEELFDTFEDYRTIISFRQPNAVGAETHSEDGDRYAQGYGKQSSAVLVPAFLAAYTGNDPNTISLDIENDVRKIGYIPRPNWNLRYDGLSKLPWFKERFSSISIQHGYASRLRINNFMSDIEYDPSDPFGRTKLNGNYYSRLEIPSVTINEQFNPIIGVSVKTKSDLTLDFEYNKSRNLDLSVNIASELNEQKKTEFVFGFAFTKKNSNFLRKKKRRGRTKKPEGLQEKEDDDSNRRRRGNVSTTRGNDMTFSLDVGYADDITIIHDIDLPDSQPSRGTTTLFISPAWEYIVNQNLKVTAFLDYNTSRSKVTQSGNQGITSIQGGIRMGLTLN